MPAIADGFQVRVNMRELKSKFEQLGRRLSTNVIRRGMLAGAGVMRDEARRKVVERTGALKKAIISETDRKGSSREVLITKVKISPMAFKITPKGKLRRVSRKIQKERGRKVVKGEVYPRAYAHLVEGGTKPHFVGKGSKTAKGGHGNMHPGTPPRPFLRPAVDTKGSEAIEVARKIIGVEIEAEITKVAGKRSRKT